MGGSVSIGATDISVADPYAWKNVMALPLTGYDNNGDFSDKNEDNITTHLKLEP